MCKRECCHCLCHQETHRSTNLPRPKITGMSLAVEGPHNKYGSMLLASRDLRKEWGDSNFQIFSQSCQFNHRRLESLEHFNVLVYIILSTTVSFLEDTILYLHVLFFHFVYISIFSQVHFACVFVFNVI